MTRPAKIVISILSVLVIVVLAPVGWYFWLSLKDANRSNRQKRMLQNRTDYFQITTACVAFARTATNGLLVWPNDPGVPAIVRSLAPRYINASTNHVTMEFHGGFEHYGYRVQQSDSNPKQWTISYYTEQGEKPLATVSVE